MLKGRPRVEMAGRSRDLKPGQAIDVPPKTIHRFCAPHGRVTLLEVSTPEVMDVVRLQDDYSRKPTKN